MTTPSVPPTTPSGDELPAPPLPALPARRTGGGRPRRARGAAAGDDRGRATAADGPPDGADRAPTTGSGADASGPGPDADAPAAAGRPSGRPGGSRSAPVSPWSLATFVVLAGTVAAYIFGPAGPSGDGTGWGLVALPVLAVPVVLLARRSATRPVGFDIAGIMVLGFALRGAGAYLRYQGGVDSVVYHKVGVDIAQHLRQLDLFVETGREIPGTGWIRYVSGVVHVPAFDDMFATTLVFTFLAWVGCWLCWEALRTAVPSGDLRRYALLVFLWPSLVYWPSSIGKEAWMLMAIGVTSWGAARVHVGRAAVGFSVLGLGLLLAALTRPHVALLMVAGFGVSLLARPRERTNVPRAAARVIGVGFLLVAGALLAGRTAELLKIDNTGAEALGTALDETEARTSQGGAAFDPAVVRTPADYPKAFVTVWLRPFPNEAHDSVALLSAAEGVALLGIAAVSWRRLAGLPRAVVRLPYVTYAAAYSVGFVYAFAAIGNFGILARQRTQGLILLFVVLCIPDRRRDGDGELDGRRRRSEPQALEPAAPTPGAPRVAASGRRDAVGAPAGAPR